MDLLTHWMRGGGVERLPLLGQAAGRIIAMYRGGRGAGGGAACVWGGGRGCRERSRNWV